MDYKYLNEIEERLRAFRVATHSQEDDPEPGWKASDDFHFNSPSDIEWLIAMLNKQLAKNQRLKEAGTTLVSYAIATETGSPVWRCETCGNFARDHSEIEHDPNCPVQVFTEES